MNSQNPLKIHVGWHIAYWVLFYSLYCLHYSSDYSTPGQIFGLELVELPLKILFTYFCLYFILPEYLLNKKYLWGFMIFLGSFAFVLVLQRLLINNVSYPVFLNQYTGQPAILSWEGNLGIGARIYSALMPAAALKAIIEWNQNLKRVNAIRTEKLTAELNYLKSQLDPHFFFNTLNNLYGLTLEKSDKAPELVLRLSELMQFIIYDTDTTTIPLVKELKQMRTYAELAEIRFGDRFAFSMNISGDPSNHEIAPLLLLPFVENCFKHGVDDEIEESWINMDITTENNILTFKIDNSISQNGNPADSFAESNHSGIGLENVQRRLKLLYPDAHSLRTVKHEDIYLTILKVNLSKLNKELES